MCNKKFGEAIIEHHKPFKQKTYVERLEDELLNALRHQKKINIELTQRIIKLEKYVAFLEAKQKE